MKDALSAVTTRQTPQSRAADPRQVPNSAGGYVFQLDDLARLRRFLVLGVDGGTYYARDVDLALENAEVVRRLADTDPAGLIEAVVDVSTTGRAPKQQPALFALAVAGAFADAEHRRLALEALPRVARTGTHLLTFVRYAQQHRGWGRVLADGVAAWYLRGDVDALAYQTVKYRQRGDWTHRDVLRRAHPRVRDVIDGEPVPDAPARRALLNWIATGDVATSRAPGGDERAVGATRADLPRLVDGFERAQRATTSREWVALIGEFGLTWEMLPTEALNQADVWNALLETGVPQTALMRQLPRLTRLNLLPATGGWTRRVCDQLVEPDRLRKARVHPLNVLVAQRTYAQGHGLRGSSSWVPTRAVVDALDAAFYAAFGAVQPTGKRLQLALDVSGSMTWSTIAGMPITPREASAALALVTANVESEYEVTAFTSGSWGRDGLTQLSISPRQRLDDVLRTIERLDMGGTDCALPMLDATRRGVELDGFVIYTDNETWAGATHPHEALRRYRQRVNASARLCVVGMTSTSFTVADPSDAGSLDVVGFDTSTPQLISDFVKGDL